MTEYRDRWISATADGLRIRGYYFPWGTKHINYTDIKAMRRVETGLFTGKGRIWGCTTLRYWASLDPKRPPKNEALVLDLGTAVSPFLTPDDPSKLEAVIRQHTALPPTQTDQSPIV